MNSLIPPESQSEASGGLSPAAKWGLWGCGGCAVVMSVAILIGGLALAQYLRQHSDSLEKIYQADTMPALMEQPGGWVRTLTAEWLITTSVAWSPDGQRLAMCAMPKIAMGKFFRMPPPMMFDPRRQGEAGMKWVLKAMGPRVVIIDVATGEEKTILGASEDLLESPEEVMWFPDGQRLAVVTSPMPTADSDEGHPPSRLWTLNADGSNLRKITEQARYPVISADGQWIAYWQERPDLEEHPLMAVRAEGGTEIRIWEQSVAKMIWDAAGDILYFRPREGEWQQVALPDGTPKRVPMRTVEKSKRAVLSSEELVGIRSFESDQTEYYRIVSDDPFRGLTYHLSPLFETRARSLGICLGGSYILMSVESPPHSHEYLLWVYRLADAKFYQVTDDPNLEALWSLPRDCVSPSGTQVCLTYSPLVPDPWKIFTTGFSTPMMLLQLDEKKILMQPGQDEPVVVSSQHQGANQ